MKNRFIPILLSFLLIIISCAKEKPMTKVIDESLAFSVKQYNLMTGVMKEKPGQLPRTIAAEGKLKKENSRWWIRGYYPGCLW